MLLVLIAALIFGSILFRRGTLLEGSTEVIEQGTKTVKATVDGKPVHSYVMPDKKER